MLINGDKSKLKLPTSIVISKEVKYLGVSIHSYVNTIAKINYTNIFKKIEEDTKRWATLPGSVPSRIAVVKMNILPRINFISSMLPLPPPNGYWSKVDSLLSKYIWNGRRPRIKRTTLQHYKQEGGWALPNSQYYHWSFTLRPLKQWFDPNSVSSWKIIEENIISPIRLKDFLFCGLSIKHCALRYGPILTYTLNIFKKIERFVGFASKWHKSSPLWHNKYLLSGKKPFVQNIWADKGIWTFGDINGNNSLLSFNELMTLYNIPKHSLFFYFRLRSALKTQNVTWGSGLKEHTVVKWLLVAPKNTVSFLYTKLLSHLSPKPNTG